MRSEKKAVVDRFVLARGMFWSRVSANHGVSTTSLSTSQLQVHQPPLALFDLYISGYQKLSRAYLQGNLSSLRAELEVCVSVLS